MRTPEHEGRHARHRRFRHARRRRNDDGAGIEEPHAKAIAGVGRDGRRDGLATRSDIRRLEDRMATKSDAAELKVAIAGLEARFHRALWIQGGAIIAILAAIRFFG